MTNWLQQIQSVLEKSAGKGKGGEGLSKMLAPGALGGLAGLLISSKSSRNLLAKYGKNTLMHLPGRHSRCPLKSKDISPSSAITLGILRDNCHP